MPDPKPLAGWRFRMHEVIFEADTPTGKAFDVALLVVIIVSVVAVFLESVNEIREQYGAILHAIMELAANLQLKVVAEGVQDTDQLTLLQALGCELGQGWLFSEPMLRFHHVLIRDAAYRRILKGTRDNGEPIAVAGCDLFTFRGDRIAVKDSYLKNRR